MAIDITTLLLEGAFEKIKSLRQRGFLSEADASERTARLLAWSRRPFQPGTQWEINHIVYQGGDGKLPQPAKAIRKPLNFDDRYLALRKTNGFCPYCGTPLKPEHPDGVQFAVDHRIPVSRGGTNDPRNLIAACHPCNNSKGDLTDFEFICKDMGIEVGWYARLNPEFDELDEDGELFVDKTAFDLAMRDRFETDEYYAEIDAEEVLS